jgi:hypothetical protein
MLSALSATTLASASSADTLTLISSALAFSADTTTSYFSASSFLTAIIGCISVNSAWRVFTFASVSKSV